MLWIPVAAWCAAAVLAVVVLGFCAYEIGWKSKRLRGDLRSLDGLADDLTRLRVQLAEAQERVAAAGSR